MATKGKKLARPEPPDDFDVATSVTNDDYFDLDEGDPHEPVLKILQRGAGTLMLPIAIKRLPEEHMDVLADLQHLALGRQRALDHIERLIGESRHLGLSWNVIGWSLGMSGQAARKRWIDLDADR